MVSWIQDEKKMIKSLFLHTIAFALSLIKCYLCYKYCHQWTKTSGLCVPFVIHCSQRGRKRQQFIIRHRQAPIPSHNHFWQTYWATTYLQPFWISTINGCIKGRNKKNIYIIIYPTVHMFGFSKIFTFSKKLKGSWTEKWNPKYFDM